MPYNYPPYYLTAYGLARKQGFQGTEEEWLESLRIPAVGVEGLDRETDRDYLLKSTVKDGYLLGRVEYAKDLSLDSIAYGGKTYREIFVGGNIIEGGDFENGIPGIGGVKGSLVGAVIQSDVSETGSHALMMDVNRLSVNVTLPEYDFINGRTYYWAIRNRIDSYTQGFVGARTVINGNAQTEVTLGAWATTSGMTTTDGIKTQSWFGCFRDGDISAILKAYIDNICILDLTDIFGESMPDKGQMDVLYEQYIRILRGAVETERTYVISNTSADAFTDEACLNAFMREMNRKAEAVGMKNSKFLTPSGLVVDGNANVSTAADAMKLLIASYGYERIAEVLGRISYTFRTGGKYVRELTTYTKLLGGNLSNTMAQNGFYFFGGKGGSLGEKYGGGQGKYGILNDTLLCGYDGKMVAVSVMGDYLVTADGKNNSITPLIIDIMKKLSGSTDATPTLDERISREEYPVSVCACVIPQGNYKAWATVGAANLIADNGGYSSTPDALHNPASVTKLLTAIMVCEYVDNLNELVTIHASDDVGGSGQDMYEGETASYFDLLHLMLMESSNPAATTLARAVGAKILQRGTKITYSTTEYPVVPKPGGGTVPADLPAAEGGSF